MPEDTGKVTLIQLHNQYLVLYNDPSAVFVLTFEEKAAGSPLYKVSKRGIVEIKGEQPVDNSQWGVGPVGVENGGA